MGSFPTALLAARAAHLADLERGGEGRLLVRSDLTGTMQLYELAGSELVQRTDLPDPVGTARYLPGSRRAVLAIDRGGNERHQLLLCDLTRDEPVRTLAQLDAITDDERFVHQLAGISPDGSAVAYVSNRRNGVDFDLWLADLAGGEPRCLYNEGGWCQPATGFSPDGTTVAITRPGPRPLDNDLLLVAVDGSGYEVVLPHPGEAAEIEGPAWGDGDRFYVASNVGGDWRTVHRCERGGGSCGMLAGAADASVHTSRDGSTLLVVENHAGAHRLRLTDDAGAPLGEVPLPEPGVVESYALAPPRLSESGDRCYFTLSTPRLAGDVFAYERGARTAQRLTNSPAALGAESLVRPEVVELEGFDGETLPLFLYRPPAAPGAPPVVVLIHGGPESQSMQSFNPVVQGLACSGYAVVVPNVRGSTGYGKRYASLDDTTRRLDSVRDLATVYAWLPSAGLDATRAALWGGSYGGYMVLAGLAFQPELWAAGVDLVGISDLVTFLENTSPYRRAHREREYGSLAADRDFLEKASPLRHVDQMRAPLFIVHGRNDPRVPVAEAEQIAARLRARKVRCELTIYEDEGHGLARLANRLDAYPRAAGFLDEVLRPSATAGA